MTDTSRHFEAAGFPLTRLHDCQWPEPAVVDIHTIFPDFRDDPGDPQSYSFLRTDDYIDSILKTGVGICYRLGESIEHSRRKYNVHPPADYEKWADVCLGIIRHYNEAWASGFHHNIRYWEIWNEPEVRPQMWSGTDEDYYRLYVLTSKRIKAKFPDLKVGGPGAALPGGFHNGKFEPTAFVAKFLERCKQEGAPLDFFSWHRYADDPDVYAKLARGVREVLDRYGFPQTESHLNEWNYLPREDWSVFSTGRPSDWERWYAEMGSAEAAAFTASSLITFQDAPLNMAFFYSADTQGFGLFTLFGEPRKPFYAIKAFRELLGTPIRLRTDVQEPGSMYALAGVDQARKEIRVLISNYRGPEGKLELRIESIPWKGTTRCEQTAISQEADWEVRQVQELNRQSFSVLAPTKPGTIYLFKLSRF
jgi:xylan 1,4-beta-xylosidase